MKTKKPKRTTDVQPRRSSRPHGSVSPTLGQLVKAAHEAGAKVTCSLVPKPPLGLRPRWLAEEQRLVEVAAAADRYLEAGTPVPASWVDEMVCLIGRMEHWRSWKQRDAMTPNAEITDRPVAGPAKGQ